MYFYLESSCELFHEYSRSYSNSTSRRLPLGVNERYNDTALFVRLLAGSAGAVASNILTFITIQRCIYYIRSTSESGRLTRFRKRPAARHGPTSLRAHWPQLPRYFYN